jgi:hypothetical protein
LDFKQEKRHYLRGLLSTLVHGDVVITLNWDTTVERTLLEDGRWNPMNGYGFEKTLCKDSGLGEVHPLDSDPMQSEIIVLKLHGSVGWHRSQGGRLYFDRNHGYLQYFEYKEGGVSIPLVDPNAPGGPSLDPVLLYPSFLKQLSGYELQLVWRKAQEALGTMECINVWGYSLPPSDVATRTLLNPVRSRLERKDVRVRVHDPSPDICARWEEFLGPLAEIDNGCLGAESCALGG